MAYTDKTYAYQEKLTSAGMNAYVRDNFRAGVPDIFTTKGDLAVASGADAAGRLGVGSDGQILVADSGETLGVRWGNGGLSGVLLNVQDGLPPLSGISGAALELVESSGAGTLKPVMYQARFDAAAKEGRMWVFRMPRNYSGSPVLKLAYRMASANSSKAVVLTAALAAVSDGDASMNAKVFASENTATVSVPDTANTQDEASITLTNADSLAAGDWVCLVVCRDGAAGGDSASGDLILTGVEVQYVS